MIRCRGRRGDARARCDESGTARRRSARSDRSPYEQGGIAELDGGIAQADDGAAAAAEPRAVARRRAAAVSSPDLRTAGHERGSGRTTERCSGSRAADVQKLPTARRAREEGSRARSRSNLSPGMARVGRDTRGSRSLAMTRRDGFTGVAVGKYESYRTGTSSRMPSVRDSSTAARKTTARSVTRFAAVRLLYRSHERDGNRSNRRCSRTPPPTPPATM